MGSGRSSGSGRSNLEISQVVVLDDRLAGAVVEAKLVLPPNEGLIRVGCLVGKALLSCVDCNLNQARPCGDAILVIDLRTSRGRARMPRERIALIKDGSAPVKTKGKGHPPVGRGVRERAVQLLAIHNRDIARVTP